MTDTPEMTDLQRAQQVLVDAKDARDALLDARNAEINDARDRIKAAWADRMATSDAAVRQAEQALNDAKLNRPRHEWDGRKVVRHQTINRYSSYNRKTVAVYGVVETRTRETQFPGNMTGWRVPQLGMPFVRLLRADGTVGLRIDTLTGWELADEPTGA